MDINLFEHLANVNIQVQKKRRKNDYGGLWGAPVDLFSKGFGFNQNSNQGMNNQGGWGQNQQQGWNQNNSGWGQSNDGWGNQGQNNWGNQGFGNSNNQGLSGVLGGGSGQLQMAIFNNMSQWGNDLSGFDWVRQQQKRQHYDMIKLNEKQEKTSNWSGIDDIFSNQITFLEPSPSAQKLQQLKRQGKQFVDDRFPPNNTSLSGEYDTRKQWSQVTWKKLDQMVSNVVVFNDKVQPGDIKQGYLGDCYYLAALAAIAQRPDRIFNLFLLRQINNVRYYSVKMLFKGKWLTIDMDQYVPSLYNKPAFSASVGNEAWVIMLEKAWAKMYSSYKRIQAGYPEQGLHDLTGAPIKQIRMKQAGFNKQAQWQYLMMASQKQYSMVASSNPGSDTNKSVSGIAQGHAYTFLNATVVNFDGGSQRLVQLRNPWGEGQSKARWSDSDSVWQRVPQSEKQRIKFNPNAKDGIFFMSYDDFTKQFRALTVCQINDNASYIYKSAKDKNSQGVYFSVQIPQHGYYSFHVDNLPERTFQDRIQQQYQYPQTTLQVARMAGNSCQKLGAKTCNDRTLFKGHQLDPGMYVVYVKIRFDSKFQKQFDVNLAVYAQYACHIDYAPRQMAVAFSGNPNVSWNPANQPKSQRWNHLGNLQYEGASNEWSGNWGNQQGGNNGGGWGQQGGNTNNNWGNNGGNDGWGGQGGNNNTSGWGGQTNNDNWNEQKNIGGDNGWGNQGNNSSSNQGGSNNNGWGQSNNINKPNNNDDGWGQQNNWSSGQGGNNNSSGWGSGW